jgi:hypothetical protein
MLLILQELTQQQMPLILLMRQIQRIPQVEQTPQPRMQLNSIL